MAKTPTVLPDTDLYGAYCQGRKCAADDGYRADCQYEYGSPLWEVWIAGFEDEDSVVYYVPEKS
jgi:hypothetical protein